MDGSLHVQTVIYESNGGFWEMIGNDWLFRVSYVYVESSKFDYKNVFSKTNMVI